MLQDSTIWGRKGFDGDSDTQ